MVAPLRQSLVLDATETVQVFVRPITVGQSIRDCTPIWLYVVSTRSDSPLYLYCANASVGP